MTLTELHAMTKHTAIIIKPTTSNSIIVTEQIIRQRYFWSHLRTAATRFHNGLSDIPL